MATLSYRTAGESHGKAMLALVEGLPAGVPVDQEFIDAELRRRQGGYGRGGRQKIETDHVDVLSGVRLNKTIASPIAMMIPNKDSRLDDLTATPPLHRPRPGHADLAGSVKWLTTDCRETLERASARETAARVAAGALSRCFLREFGIEVFGFVRTVGPATASFQVTPENWRELFKAREESDVYCPDPAASQAMREFINDQKMAKDTAGGIVEAHVFGCPIGIGSCMTDRKSTRLNSSHLVISYAVFCLKKKISYHIRCDFPHITYSSEEVDLFLAELYPTTTALYSIRAYPHTTLAAIKYQAVRRDAQCV